MRMLPLTQDDRKEMMETIGVSQVDDLYKEVPKSAFIDGLADIAEHKGELEVERIMSAYSNQNHAAGDGVFFLGAGCYYHHVPATADHIIQRSEFLTAYTPYQPEIAQGTLQVIYEFQTMIAMITGQEIANASLYDGATAMTEAALMAMRLTRKNKVVLWGTHHPQYEEVLHTYQRNLPEMSVVHGSDVSDETACVIVQYPDFHGEVPDLAAVRGACDAVGAKMVVVVNEIVALGMLPAPSMADIVCGEAQSIGLPMSFGGPHLGFFACKEAYVRQMPGRLCGETVDADGKRSFVLTLSTREQHIRREKATSNICTNQGLCALAFSVHMALLGEAGYKHLARLNHEKAMMLADALEKIEGVSVVNESFFNEFVVRFEGADISAEGIVTALAKDKIIAGLALNETDILLAATEMTRDEDIAALSDALTNILGGAA